MMRAPQIASRTSKSWAIAGSAVAASALAIALISQYGFGLAPCPLCIWQRYPYAVSLTAAAAGFLVSPRAFFSIAAMVFLIGAGIGVFHSGVEFQWWDGLASCSAPPVDGVSADEFLERLRQVEITRCDERAPFFLGLSMANWNVLTSVFVATCFAVAARSSRAARDQSTFDPAENYSSSSASQ